MRKETSFKTLMILMNAALIVVLLLAAAYVFYTVRSSQKEMSERMTDAIEDQMNSVDELLRAMNAYLVNTLHNAGSIDNLLAAPDVHTQNVAARKLIDDLYSKVRQSTSPVNFYFVCLKNGCEFHVFDQADPAYPVGMEVIQTLSDHDLPLPASNQWQYLSALGEDLLLKEYRYRTCVLYCWMPLEGLFDPVKEKVLSEDGLIRYLDQDTLEPMNSETVPSLDSSRFSCMQPIKYTSLQVLITDSFPFSIQSLILPLFLVLLIVSTVFSLSLYTLYYFRRHIERPIKNMSSLIDAYSTDQLSYRKTGIREINETLDALSGMRGQLEKLKIDMYEERLNHSKTELQYYQLQIKPHFFVNCFSIIYAMAQKKNYTGIQNFCLKLSSYVRFHFLNSFDLIPLSRELQHLSDYLDIQNIRHHTSSQIHEQVDEELCS
ncbi:MAG: histidine kinase, partial [Solobacterium sp.]|nr:histidine kinase [Solobacterium sp.]